MTSPAASTAASLAVPSAVLPEAEQEEEADSRVNTPDITAELDTDFVNILPGSDGEEEENENNNANNLNNNNNAAPLDPDYGESFIH